ncbi:alpha/beta hydrolase [Flagellimonas sp.]|uniref:alpha/beta hydrolase n=1 Tax=Flagellimonas sp. TaxID=2058762 RepID=UPI003B58D949
MKKFIQLKLLLIGLLFGNTVEAQTVYKLWEKGKKPYYKENDLKEYEKEVWETLCVFNITEPTLTVYKAKGENSGKAVIIIPGGGYGLVAMHHEGYDVAEKLSSQGITAAVLKYRLPNPKSSDQPHLVPLTDTRRALKLLRGMAAEHGFNKEKVGVLGFSAGSHLATVAGLWKSDDKEENPNFSGLIYGVTNLSEANLKWLEKSLYHRKLTNEEINQNRLLDLVSENTPPAFLVHAYDDGVCLVEETTLYAQQLSEHNILVETHLFSKGGHGFGLGKKEDGTHQWIDLFINWVKTNNL